LEEFSIFVFDACYINECIKFDDFFLINYERKKKPIHVPIFQKNCCLGSTQYAFLDHSKALVFIDVIKIEIIFKYLCACATRTYSLHAKKTL